jgi:nucleoside-diphosphate-sugar epimerase
MKVLVTGASGFVGSAIVKSLSEQGIETVGTSRRVPAGDRTPADWRTLDLMDSATVRRFIDEVRPTHIIHSAWTVEHGRFWEDPTNLDWVRATLNLARIARAHDCQKFVGLGTCFEYQWPNSSPCDEHSTPIANHTLYDSAKDATRRILSAFFHDADCSLAWARLFYLYGDGERLERLVPSIANAIANGRSADCSSGYQIRDFIHVSDAARAVVALTISNVTGAVNIGSGKPVSIADIARMIGKISGRPDLIQLGARADRAEDAPYIVAGLARLQGELGFESKISLDAGLKAVVAHYQALWT